MKGSVAQRLQGVDVLRALAILFVLMNHVNMQLRFAGVSGWDCDVPCDAATAQYSGQWKTAGTKLGCRANCE